MTGLPKMRLTRITRMLDLAMHPKFAENRLIYFTCPKPLEGETYTRALDRGRYDGAGLVEVKELSAGDAVRTCRGTTTRGVPDRTAAPALSRRGGD